MLAIQIVMPSEGDMSLVQQNGGAILLRPVFYGGESAGPHIQVVEISTKDGKPATDVKIVKRYRLRRREDGKIEIKQGKMAEDGEDKPE